uniref:Uncharacterized protein n=1 Tax=Romanomermis culicivorax TaxID=13658 RepID=A0A915IE57_ROMCU
MEQLFHGGRSKWTGLGENDRPKTEPPAILVSSNNNNNNLLGTTHKEDPDPFWSAGSWTARRRFLYSEDDGPSSDYLRCFYEGQQQTPLLGYSHASDSQASDSQMSDSQKQLSTQSSDCKTTLYFTAPPRSAAVTNRISVHMTCNQSYSTLGGLWVLIVFVIIIFILTFVAAVVCYQKQQNRKQRENNNILNNNNHANYYEPSNSSTAVYYTPSMLKHGYSYSRNY